MPAVKEAALVIPLLIIGVFGSSAVGLLIAVYYQKSNDKASKRWMYGFLFALTTQLLYIIVVIFVGGQTYTIVIGKKTYTMYNATLFYYAIPVVVIYPCLCYMMYKVHMNNEKYTEEEYRLFAIRLHFDFMIVLLWILWQILK